MYARHERKPLWQLISDFTPEEFVKATAFRCSYFLLILCSRTKISRSSDITDAITPAEALELLRSKQAGKAERLARIKKEGYPSYTTSVGWFGYSDEKVARLTRSVPRSSSFARS